MLHIHVVNEGMFLKAGYKDSKMNQDIRKTKRFLLSTLTLSMYFCLNSAHALQAMTESDMRAVDGQDGITASINYNNVNIDQVAWIDQSGLSAGTGEQQLKAALNGVKINRGTLADPAVKLGTTATLDVYSNASGNVGLGISTSTILGKLTTDSIKICAKSTKCDGADNTAASLGALSIEAYNPLTFGLVTSKGLFSGNDLANLVLGIQNVNIGLAQKQPSGGSGSTINTLAMKNFNFNLSANGYVYVDPVKGLTLATNSPAGGTTTKGYADFLRTANNRPGINLEYTINDRGLIQAGASGRILNGIVQVGSGSVDQNLLGNANRNGSSTANSIVGSTGIKLKIAGDFTNDLDVKNNLITADQATTLELGGAGAFSYGFRFQNITPLVTRKGVTGSESGATNIALNSADRGGLNMDGIYVNLVDSNTIKLPENTSLTNVSLGGANKLATANDYIQTISATAAGAANPYSTVIAIRDMDFASLSRRGQFIASSDVTDASKLPSTTAAKWGLGLPIYNFNANLAIYGKQSNASSDFIIGRNAVTASGATTYYSPTLTGVTGSERLGFSASISTKGVSADGSKTTSILLIDGGDNNNYTGGTITPTDYYFGLRNIDMLLNGYGSIGLENGQLNVSMPDLKMIMSAQLAAGYLPGAKYKTCPTGTSVGGCFAPSNNFLTNNDVLAGIKVRLNGSIYFALIPRALLTDQNQLVDGVNALNIVGVMNLNSGQAMNNVIQIADPDGSTLGLDNLAGKVGFDTSIVVNKDNVGFNYNFIFNPDKNKDGVFRVKDMNLYPATGGTVGSPQRLGEIAVTGGRLSSSMAITPRDGAFNFN